MPHIILDTDKDTLRCYECREQIGPDEPKVIIGAGLSTANWSIYHPGCQPVTIVDVTIVE